MQANQELTDAHIDLIFEILRKHKLGESAKVVKEFFERTDRPISWSKINRAIKRRTGSPASTFFACADIPEVEWDPMPTAPTGTSASKIRFIIPDFHGSHQDTPAVNAMLSDLASLGADEIVFLGDFVDLGSCFSTHTKAYISELDENYQEDIAAAARVFDAIQGLAPQAKLTVIAGNHDVRVAKKLTALGLNSSDARFLDSLLAPENLLRLEERGRFIRSDQFYDGLASRGVCKMGKCHFVHGISIAKHAASVHLAAFGASVFFGHVHRAQSEISRTIEASAIGAWCPGTLSELAPLYMHTAPTTWTHGYAIQFVERGGRFVHLQVPIIDGVSLLQPLLSRLRPKEQFA